MLLPLLILFLAAIAVLAGSVTTSEEGTDGVRPWRRLERATAWLAVSLAAAASAALAFIPTYATVSEVSSAGIHVTQRRAETFLSVDGNDLLPFLILPVVVACVPLFRGTPHQHRSRAALVAVVLLGFTIISGFSIGLFYAPSAVAMLAAATLGVVIERTA